MGIELAFGIASLAVGVISGINQMDAAGKTADAALKSAALAKKSAAADREANDITAAQQSVNALEDRRQRVREERVRRGAMLSAAEGTGARGSSGESGGISALGTNYGVLISGARGTTRANEGINTNRQRAMDFDTEARVTTAKAGAGQARADAFSSFLGIFQQGFKSFGSSTIFD